MKIFIIVLTIALTMFTGLSGSSEQDGDNLLKLKNSLIVIKKKERLLELYDNQKIVKTYKIVLGFAPTGNKTRQGDGKTPEGEFYVFTKNDRSKFYLSLGLSYPNTEDARRGLQNKLISQKEFDLIAKAISEKKMPLQNTKLGGEIYIHGGGGETDWTQGCVALADEEIKEIFDAVEVGTIVKIEP